MRRMKDGCAIPGGLIAKTSTVSGTYQVEKVDRTISIFGQTRMFSPQSRTLERIRTNTVVLSPSDTHEKAMLVAGVVTVTTIMVMW